MTSPTLPVTRKRTASRLRALLPGQSTQHVWLILLFAFVVLAARVPRLLREGRVNAEEGTTYLRYAWDATPWRSFIAPHQGYYSLLDNVAALAAARVFPLSATAMLFSWTALFIWLAVAYLILCCEIFASPVAKFVAVAAFLFTAPSVEVWLILETCQFALIVGAAIILVSDEHRHRPLRFSFLILAGLSSVPACFLLPLFCLRAYFAKSRDRLNQAILLLVPTVLQMLLLIPSMLGGARGMKHPYRFFGFALVQRAVIAQFLPGRATLIFNSFVQHHLSTALLSAFWVLAIVAIAFTVHALRGRPAVLWVIAAALLICVLDWYGSGTSGVDFLDYTAAFDNRYFWPMAVLLNLALTAAVFQKVSGGARVRQVTGVLLILALLSGVFQYKRDNKYISDYPAWKPQVDAWSKDPGRAIITGPYFWTSHPLYLSPNHGDNPHLPYNAYDSFLAGPRPR